MSVAKNNRTVGSVLAGERENSRKLGLRSYSGGIESYASRMSTLSRRRWTKRAIAYQIEPTIRQMNGRQIVRVRFVTPRTTWFLIPSNRLIAIGAIPATGITGTPNSFQSAGLWSYSAGRRRFITIAANPSRIQVGNATNVIAASTVMNETEYAA